MVNEKINQALKFYDFLPNIGLLINQELSVRKFSNQLYFVY